MYNIKFFRDKKGNEAVLDYINKLNDRKNNKRARIKLDKINQCINLLKESGTSSGPPLIRHLEDNLYKIRALDSRFFFLRDENNFVFLTHFIKNTQKTPEKEKNLARKRRKEYYELKD